MRILSLLLACVALLASNAGADVLFLNDGTEISGRLRGLKAGRVQFRAAGKNRSYPVRSILKIKMAEDAPASVKHTDPMEDPEVAALAGKTITPADLQGYGHINYLIDTSFEIRPDGSSSMTERILQKVFKERAREETANPRFLYLEGYQRATLNYARAVTNGKADYVDDTIVQSGSEHGDSPYYAQLKSMKFSLPSVAEGSIIDYSYTVETSSGGREFPFYGETDFGAFAPTATRRVTLTTPDGVKILWKMRNPGGPIAFSSSTAKGITHYIWQASDLPLLREEDNAPSADRLLPILVIAREDGWTAIREMLSSAAEKAYKQKSPLAGIVRKARQGTKDEDGLARRLYDWVQSNISFVPVQLTDSSPLPLAPGRIMAHSSGNYLDKPFLLWALLKEAGLKANLLYLASDSRAAFDSTMPSVRQFDSAAVELETASGPVLLFPYEESIYYGYIPPYMQGAEGLRLEGADMFVSVPQLAPEAESLVQNNRITLSADGGAQVEMTLEGRGSYAASWHEVARLNPLERRNSLEHSLHEFHPKAVLSSYEIPPADNFPLPAVLKYSFSIPGLALTGGDYMALVPPGIAKPTGDVADESRVSPLYYARADRQVITTAIVLPDGYETHYIPPAIKTEGGCAAYEAGYTVKDGALILAETLTRSCREILPRDYEAYRVFRNAAARFAESWIVLKKRH